MIVVARAAQPAPVVSLFEWRSRAEAARLQERRVALQKRIAHLPRRSFRRITLEARLADITAEQLRLESLPEDLG